MHMTKRRGPTALLAAVAFVTYTALVFLLVVPATTPEGGSCPAADVTTPILRPYLRREVTVLSVKFPKWTPWKPSRYSPKAPSAVRPTEAELYQTLSNVELSINTETHKVSIFSRSPWASVVFKSVINVVSDPICVGSNAPIPHATLVVDDASHTASQRMGYLWGSLHVFLSSRATLAIRTRGVGPSLTTDTFQQMVDVILTTRNVTAANSSSGVCMRIREFVIPLPSALWPESLKAELRWLVLQHYNLSVTLATTTPNIVVYSGTDRKSRMISNANVVFEAFQRVLSSNPIQAMRIVHILETLSFEAQVRFLHNVCLLFTMDGDVALMTLFMPLYGLLYIVRPCHSNSPITQLFPTQNVRQWRMCDGSHGGLTVCVPSYEPSDACDVAVDPDFAWLTMGSLLEEDVRQVVTAMSEFVGPAWLRELLEVMYVERGYNETVFVQRYALTNAYVVGFGGQRSQSAQSLESEDDMI